MSQNDTSPTHPETTYSITDLTSGSTGSTTDAEVAEKYARRADYRVTAETEGDR